MKNLYSYIDRVIDDAHRAEGRQNHSEKGYVRLVICTDSEPGRKYLFVDAGFYGRVRRRVEYRLTRNLVKHFPALGNVTICGAKTSCMHAKWYQVNPDGTTGEFIEETGLWYKEFWEKQEKERIKREAAL
jgi:hypothetical protein